MTELLAAVQGGMPGWQQRVWEFFVFVAAMGGIVFVVFWWLPRLRNPRCAECGNFMVVAERNLVHSPYEDEEGKYHRGREEVIYRCPAGHELRRERDYASADPWAGTRPEDVYGRDRLASWLENEANVGQRETLLERAARRLREETGSDNNPSEVAQPEDEESNKHEHPESDDPDRRYPS